MIPRRQFITLLGGVAAAWPVAARGQQNDRMRRIGVLNGRSRDDPEYQARMAAFQQALAQLGWTDGRNLRIDIRWATKADDLRRHAVELAALAPDDIEVAFGHFVREGAQALIFPTDATVSSNRKRIANLAIKARLPSIFPYRDSIRDGVLMNYGVDPVENYRRAADFVHKILQGAKPGDLPVEFPTRLYLGVNLRTAKAIGLTISESFLVRADEVID